jgi:phage/conjugal plasmid C-4 type zinc finger TraR family protein
MADDADRAQEYLDRAMRRYQTRPITPHAQFRQSTDCNDCGDDIPMARLKIFPYAVRCAECQGYFERYRG